jgi:hypothetical protein
MIGPGKAVFLLASVILLIGCGDHQQRGNSAETSSAKYGEDSSSRLSAPDSVDKIVNAVDVIRYYYEAIGRQLYDTAYGLWGQGGKASGQTRSEFAAGFAQTASVRASIGDSVRLEGAAGSQYATVPVTVDAVLNDGARQHFEGFYTLRRAIVDGATPEERRWHIYSAHLR